MYAKKHNIKVKPSNSIFSIDQNLWGRSIESGPLEDPNTEPPAERVRVGHPSQRTPLTPRATSSWASSRGCPLGGRRGEGRPLADPARERVRGEARRRDHRPHRGQAGRHKVTGGLRGARQPSRSSRRTGTSSSWSSPGTSSRSRSAVEREWSWLVYSGLWMEPLRFALDSFIKTTQRRVSGSVRLKLYKGGLRVVGRSSPNSLYNVCAVDLPEGVHLRPDLRGRIHRALGSAVAHSREDERPRSRERSK